MSRGIEVGIVAVLAMPEPQLVLFAFFPVKVRFRLGHRWGYRRRGLILLGHLLLLGVARPWMLPGKVISGFCAVRIAAQ